MFQVAMLSKWHVHAKDYAKQIQEFGNVKITCVWDEEKQRGAEWAEELGVDFEPDLDTLLARKDVDGVIVDTPTSMHFEVIKKAAEAGKHIFTEKVLTFDKASALKLKEIIEQSGVQFVISYPQRTTPEFVYAKKLLDEGEAGRPTMVRIRNGHNGAVAGWLPVYWYDPETCGGGAMMDLGCHPMYLSRWMLGTPKTITSAFSYITGREVEDSAVCSVLYENGAIAVVESSLASYYSPYMMEIYGTQGSIYIREGQIEIKSEKRGGEITVIEKNTLEKTVPSAMEQWVNACTKGGEILFGINEAIELTELMEAAYRSGKEGRTIVINNE